ncbi:cytochrome P450 [Mycena albidolilacea]|uniref:Cytochrome P450 n=1 Tax=Mycena albidolilacea TaxID=1033008 RepID=A0AAD7AAW8_9AGAR|nr:cytochrome P450 [Mycena albidolilacea]
MGMGMGMEMEMEMERVALSWTRIWNRERQGIAGRMSANQCGSGGKGHWGRTLTARTGIGRKVTVALSAKGSNFVLGGKSTAFNAEGAYIRCHLTIPVFGKDVFYDCPNEIFQQQKQFVKFGLTTENFRQYVGMIEDEVDEFIEKSARFRTYQQNDINEWGNFDAIAAMAEITILTASRTLQGKKVCECLNKSFSQLYIDLDSGFTPLNFLFANLPLESYCKRDHAQKEIRDFYLRDHEISHIMIALLMAGQHTSSATLAWTMLHLTSRPDVADALYAKQVKRFANPDGSLPSMSYEDLRHLPVLDSCIRETLRVHPPIHSIMRQVREDVPVLPTLATPNKDGGIYVMPKDTYVLVSPLISQIDARIWKDGAAVAAQALSAYTDEGGEKVDYRFGAVSKPYQPLGTGKHRCLGEQFAYLQIGTVIATIIRRVEVYLQRLERKRAPNFPDDPDPHHTKPLNIKSCLTICNCT